jgi:hypothetical protein
MPHATATVIVDDRPVSVSFETGKSWRVRDFLYIKLGPRLTETTEDYELHHKDERQVDTCIHSGDTLYLRRRATN